MPDQVNSSGKKAPKIQAFLAAIRVCPSISRAAKAAGVDRREHYRRYKADKVYAKAFDEAYAMGVQALEDACMEHALEGFEQPVIWQGLVSYAQDEHGSLLIDEQGRLIPLTVRKHSVELKKFMLQGARPEKYRTNHHVEGSITHSGITSVPDAELERIALGNHPAASRGGAAEAEAEPEQAPDVLPG